MNLKQDFSFYANSNNTARFGFNVIYHTFKPGELDSEGENAFNDIILEQQNAFESGIYGSNEQKIGSRLNINYGSGYSMFNSMGPCTV